jgi:predicted permease
MREPAWRRYARLSGPDLRADVDEELEFHIEILADRYRREGHSAEEARAMATTEFGDRERARDACVAIDQSRMRDERRTEWWSTFWQDLRHGARRLLSTPVFTIVTVLTLAIGIGPNIAVFSIINSVLLQPLPYASPDRLVQIFETFHVPGTSSAEGSVSFANYADWKARNSTFDRLGVSTYAQSANLQEAGNPEKLTVAAVDADLFPTLGVRPILGRTFARGEDVKGAPKVILLGEDLWRRRFGADPAIVGKKIIIDGAPSTVIGVMPSRITFPNRSAVTDAWTAIPAGEPPYAPINRGGHMLIVVGRLKPGVTLAAAQRDLANIATQLQREYPKSQDGRSVSTHELRDTVVGKIKPQLLVLLGAAGLVLLIACANAASLLLARASARQREVAVRAALGASRGRIAQQFLTESLLLAAVGSAIGFVLARVGVRAVVAGAAGMLPRATEIHFDARVVAFMVGAILITTILFGLLPSLQATRTDLQNSLREGGRSDTANRSRGAFRRSLVVAQFALSLVLLAGAGLLMRTFAALLGTETGMSTEHVLTMHIPFPANSPRYPDGETALSRFFVPMLQRVSAVPGVQHAGVISLLPLQDSYTNGSFWIAGKSYARTSDVPFAEWRFISPGYFQSLGIPLRRGRDIALSDDQKGEQVVIVNDALAKQFFPNEDPIGKAIYAGGAPQPNTPPIIIVGIAGDVRESRLDEKPQPVLYFPYTQNTWALGDMVLVVKSAGDEMRLAKPIQAAIRSVDPTQPVFAVRSMSDVISQSIADRRLYLGLLGVFAGVALLLAIAGIYGVMSYSVTQRTREFGIRLALGSEASRVRRLVVWQGTRLALIGLVLGIPSAFLLTRLLRSLLYDVQPGDPATLAGVSLLLAVVSVLASYIPASRATRVDPIIAMRAE